MMSRSRNALYHSERLDLASKVGVTWGPTNLPRQVVEGAWVGHLWYRARPLQPPDARVYARADLRLDKAVLE
jgi:hypothetical protein